MASQPCGGTKANAVRVFTAIASNFRYCQSHIDVFVISGGGGASSQYIRSPVGHGNGRSNEEILVTMASR